MDSPTTPASAPVAPAAPTAQPQPAVAGGYISNPYRLIKPAFEAFKLSWVSLLLLIVAVVVGVGVLAGLGFLAASAGPLAILIPILLIPVFLLGSGYVGYAFTKIILGGARGQKVAFKDSLPTIRQAWDMFVVSLLVGLIFFIGFLLFIIPGIIFLTWFSYATFYLVDENIGGIDALRKSRDLVRGRFWEVLGVTFMPASLAIVGIIPILGALAYFVFSILITPLPAVRFQQLKDLKKRPDWDKVPVSGLNYLAIVAGLIISAVGQAASFSNALQKAGQQQTQQSPFDSSVDYTK